MKLLLLLLLLLLPFTSYAQFEGVSAESCAASFACASQGLSKKTFCGKAIAFRLSYMQAQRGFTDAQNLSASANLRNLFRLLKNGNLSAAKYEAGLLLAAGKLPSNIKSKIQSELVKCQSM